MSEKTKELKRAASCAAIAALLIFGMTLRGCESSVVVGGMPEEEVFEYGDFQYNLIKLNSENKYVVYLNGLSETGKTKEVVVVPSRIEGYKVTVLSLGGSMWSDETAYDFGFLESENLKAIYIPKGLTVSAVKTFTSCPNLRKIVILNYVRDYKAKLEWNQKEYVRYDKNAVLAEDGTAYCSESTYYANVSYYYNYENASDDFYWIDNFAYGKTIGYVPEDPVREGYAFGGWYKEETCENRWNFETDVLPKAKYNENKDELYQETRLYAKWIEE